MSDLAVVYAAKSTKDRHLSIPEQLGNCREMSAENDWEVLGEFVDEGFTAYTGNRGPGLAAAIDLAKRTAAERGEQVFLVAQHTSRFARGDGAAPGAPRALVELWHEWARANVRGRTVENDYAMQSSVAAGTQGEADHSDSKRKSTSIRKGLRRRARDRGKIAGGFRPFAYRWEDGELVGGTGRGPGGPPDLRGIPRWSVADGYRPESDPRRHQGSYRRQVDPGQRPPRAHETALLRQDQRTAGRSTRVPVRRS